MRCITIEIRTNRRLARSWRGMCAWGLFMVSTTCGGSSVAFIASLDVVGRTNCSFAGLAMRRPALDRGLLAIADCSRLFRGLPMSHLKSQRGRRGSRILCNYGVCGIPPTAALSNLFYDGGLYLRCWWVKLDGRDRTASRDRCSGRKYPTSVKTRFWEFRHSLVLIGVTPADDFV